MSWERELQKPMTGATSDIVQYVSPFKAAVASSYSGASTVTSLPNSLVISQVISQEQTVLPLGLDAMTKHKWAQDLFGLSKLSVSTLLATPQDDEPSNKRPRSAVRQVAAILMRLQNIRNRGSGPTSQLQRNEDRCRCNSHVIHQKIIQQTYLNGY